MTPLLLFLLACATVYVGTVQAAFTAFMQLSLRLMLERTGRSEELERYLEDPAELLVPARLLLAVMVVFAGVLIAMRVGLAYWHTIGLVVLSMLAFAIVCEHLLPRVIVRDRPQRTIEALLPSFAVVIAALRPIVVALDRLGRVRRAPAAAPAADGNGAEATPAAEEPAIEAPTLQEGDERALLRSIVDFGDRLVREVMTPRPDIVAIQSDATLADLRAFFREQEYSRIPVYQESLDNILGFAFVKDLIRFGDLPDTTPVTDLLRPAYFVPETKRVPELLKEFQREQVQSAIVVDEYGGTAGLVSLEDLLEEIVGEIRDEYDVESESIVDDGNGSYVITGKVDVDEVAERLGVQIARAGFETLGGYLLSHLGRVPAVGETFDVDDLSVEVLEAERRRVQKVRIRRKQPVAQEP